MSRGLNDTYSISYRLFFVLTRCLLIIAFIFAWMSIARIAHASPNVHALTHIPVCTVGNPETPRCHTRVVTDEKGKPQATTSPTGYGPAQLLSAYSLNGSSSVTRTIAIVDAYDHPNIASDLATFSSQYGIPTLPSCPVESGTAASPCFQKVDQRGGNVYPATDSGWALEIALDVETAHSICQNCNILLVEADSSTYDNLLSSIDKARNMGAAVISNSWGSVEFSAETTFGDSHFNYPGIAFTFSSGDSGYGTSYPAASRYVTAVGGTSLYLNSDNTWNSEVAWSGSGSGCSRYEAKPSWQLDKGCARRMIADVSADADPSTGMSVYDTVPYYGQAGWWQVGGTSLSSPIIAGVYALSGNTSGAANALPYSLGNSANLHDVTSGNNGSCRRQPSYFCKAGNGYDGPTGMGTPKGSGAF